MTGFGRVENSRFAALTAPLPSGPIGRSTGVYNKTRPMRLHKHRFLEERSLLLAPQPEAGITSHPPYLVADQDTGTKLALSRETGAMGVGTQGGQATLHFSTTCCMTAILVAQEYFVLAVGRD